MTRLEEIIVSQSTRGDGTEKNPTRTVTEYWSKDGDRLAEVDPLAPWWNASRGCFEFNAETPPIHKTE